MTAIAVWDHRPSTDELLAARLDRGWKPTAAAYRDGARIDGFSSCLLPEEPPS